MTSDSETEFDQTPGAGSGSQGTFKREESFSAEELVKGDQLTQEIQKRLNLHTTYIYFPMLILILRISKHHYFWIKNSTKIHSLRIDFNAKSSFIVIKKFCLILLLEIYVIMLNF